MTAMTSEPSVRCPCTRTASKGLLGPVLRGIWASWRAYRIRKEIRHLHSSIARVAEALGYRPDQMPFLASQVAKKNRIADLQYQLRRITMPHLNRPLQNHSSSQ